jgi:hypothetical protein
VSPREPAWPCPNVVPGMAPVAVILARTGQTVVAVTGIPAYPAGFGFALHLRLRGLDPRVGRELRPFPRFGRHRGHAWPADALRLTVAFADGRSVTNVDPPTVGPDGPDPDRPVLSSGPGTGMEPSGPFRDRWIWDLEYRVRPLPPPGPLAFVCAWRARGIPASRVEIDGAAIGEAATAAVPLWPDDPYCSHD